MTIPPKPAAFTPAGAPDGVEVRFVTFLDARPSITPRSIFVHTNGASGEGSIDSAWNWAHAAPNKNTVPHYQVDRAHNGVLRARKMLPSNRQGIANATITSGHKDWPKLTAAQQASILAAGNKSIATWSLAIETADLGWPTPGGACGFEEQQGEKIAEILAYESIVWGFPLVRLPAWDGAGVAAHTEPFTRPFTTLYVKPCPGDAKKADLWSWVLPRAVEIAAAWTAPDRPVVIDLIPPSVPPGGDLMITVFQPPASDCLAEFIAMCDQNGNALEVEWINTPAAQARRDAHIAAGARIDRGPVTGGRFRNCKLSGPIPHGDTYHWSEADFFRVVG